LQKQLASLQQGHAANTSGDPTDEMAFTSDQLLVYITKVRGSRTLDPRSPLSFELQSAPWLKPFVLNKCNTYNGLTDPYAFVLIFETSIEATGGDDTTKAKAFIMAATGIARAWYTALAPGSIESWDQLRDLIIFEFQGNYTHAVTSGDLHAC